MNKNKEKGFTLIELLIAMSIASLIAMAFFTFINSSIKFNAKNEKDIKALNIAQSEIENLREQIKTENGDSNLIIDLDENKIEIYKNSNGDISWIWVNNREIVTVNKAGKYKNYIGNDEYGNSDNSRISYKIKNNKEEYRVTIMVGREKIGSKYLYDIRLDVKNENSYFSKKTTTLVAKILSK